MAIFDNIGGLLADYGIGVPRNTGLISNTADIDAINKRALTSGLINAGLTYLATPKNLNVGSALPYLGRAALSGFGASQNTIDQALNTAYRNKLIAGRDDIFSNINPLDVTPESLEAYIKGGKKDPSVLRRAAPVEKPQGPMIVSPGSTVYDPTSNEARYTAPKEKDTTDITNYNEARKEGYKGTFTDFLNLKKPQTNINMPAGQTKYDETLGAIRAKQDVDIVETANKSKNNISKIDMTLNQIQNSNAITGFGADIQKNVNRFAAKVLKDAKAGKQVADTEILDAFLGSDVFPQIGALGIGAKGLDTPAEREFLRQVMTGTVSMNKDALIKMTQIRRDIEKRSIDRYNSAVDSGELNDYFSSTKRQKKLIDIPDNSGFRIVP